MKYVRAFASYMDRFFERHEPLFRGMASVLDLSGRAFYREDRTYLQRSDYEALRSDWLAIGRDFRTAIDRFNEDNPDIAARVTDTSPTSPRKG